MTLVLFIIIVAAIALALLVPVVRLALVAVSDLILLAVIVLFFVDVANGAPVTRAIIGWLWLVFQALYNGISQAWGV